MKPEVAEALEASIKHWEENVAATDPLDVSISDYDCALCKMFDTHTIDYCTGCPVYAATGKRLCGGTPYSKAHRALIAWQDDTSDTNRLNFQAEAQAEVDFLKSLREPKS